MKKCSNCGYVTSRGDNYCTHCGTKIEKPNIISNRISRKDYNIDNQNISYTNDEKKLLIEFGFNDENINLPNKSISIVNAIDDYLTEEHLNKNLPIYYNDIALNVLLEDTCRIISFSNNEFKLFSKNKGYFNVKNIICPEAFNYNEKIIDPVYFLIAKFKDGYERIDFSRKSNITLYNKIPDDFFLFYYDENNIMHFLKNDEELFKIENVADFKYINNLTIAYNLKNDESNKIEEFNGEKMLVSTIKNVVNDSSNEHISLREHIVDNDYFKGDKYIKFYFSFYELKNFYIIFDYCLNNSDKMSIIKNDIDIDDSINYEVCFDRKKIEEIEFCFSSLYYSTQMLPIKILGYPLYELVNFITRSNETNELLKYKNDNYSNIGDTVSLIKSKLNIKTNEELINYLEQKYGKINIISWVRGIYFKNINIPEDIEDFYTYYGKKNKEFNEKIYKKIITSNKYAQINYKWKNELKLFNLINNYFKDSIYQYRNKWLGQQSLDIYIPSINTAFEYQGIQHFEPIELFGGEKGFKKRQELDFRKKALCKENNVNLIEWFYYEDITLIKLMDKLKQNNIEVDISIFNKKIKEESINNESNIFLNFPVINTFTKEK